MLSFKDCAEGVEVNADVAGVNPGLLATNDTPTGDGDEVVPKKKKKKKKKKKTEEPSEGVPGNEETVNEGNI